MSLGRTGDNGDWRLGANTYRLHKKGKDICQYLDLNTKIKANSRNCTKHLEHFKYPQLFLCSLYVFAPSLQSPLSPVRPKDI